MQNATSDQPVRAQWDDGNPDHRMLADRLHQACLALAEGWNLTADEQAQVAAQLRELAALLDARL